MQGISELITEPGEINIDFADVKTVMKGRGDALMGIGIGEGSSRAVDAARAAISNPLLENASIEGAKSVLVNLAGGDGLTLQEYQDVVELITENCAEDALIIAGQAYNPELEKDQSHCVATGFDVRRIQSPRSWEKSIIANEGWRGLSLSHVSLMVVNLPPATLQKNARKKSPNRK